MKLLIIASFPSSLSSFRGPLIDAVARMGVEVHAAAPEIDSVPGLRDELVRKNVEAHEIPMQRAGMNPLRDVQTLYSLYRVMRRERPDIVLVYTIKPVIYGTLAAWLAGVPRRIAMIEGLGFVFTPNGDTPSISRRLLRLGVRSLYKLALSKAHRAIFLNPDDRAEFVDQGLLPRIKSYLLGGIGVDLAKWKPMPFLKQPVTFMLIARLLREKGVLEFVEAARIVKRRHPETRFVLLGDVDPNPGSLPRQLADAWVNEGVLEWPGHVPVIPWLAQSSVYVLPSYREGVPMSTQEAMAMGRAIITTDVPGCRETVVEGVNGFLVPVRDAQALAASMAKFINDPELIGRMGRESRRLAEERFDVHKVNRRLIELMLNYQGDSQGIGR
ncbi:MULTISPECIES: glycosyltransferase family 4 protein [Variovorax]|uniref:glycosyltransferase family 4 protein n=1 Tax=Variovorax TaxID=34072 RepID=UPI0034E8B847